MKKILFFLVFATFLFASCENSDKKIESQEEVKQSAISADANEEKIADEQIEQLELQPQESENVDNNDTIFESIDVDASTKIVFTSQNLVEGEDGNTLHLYGNTKILRNGQLIAIDGMPDYCGFDGNYYFTKGRDKIILDLMDCGWLSYDNNREWHERHNFYLIDIKANRAQYFNWDIELDLEE